MFFTVTKSLKDVKQYRWYEYIPIVRFVLSHIGNIFKGSLDLVNITFNFIKPFVTNPAEWLILGFFAGVVSSLYFAVGFNIFLALLEGAVFFLTVVGVATEIERVRHWTPQQRTERGRWLEIVTKIVLPAMLGALAFGLTAFLPVPPIFALFGITLTGAGPLAVLTISFVITALGVLNLVQKISSPEWRDGYKKARAQGMTMAYLMETFDFGVGFLVIASGLALFLTCTLSAICIFGFGGFALAPAWIVGGLIFAGASAIVINFLALFVKTLKLFAPKYSGELHEKTTARIVLADQNAVQDLTNETKKAFNNAKVFDVVLTPGQYDYRLLLRNLALDGKKEYVTDNLYMGKDGSNKNKIVAVKLREKLADGQKNKPEDEIVFRFFTASTNTEKSLVAFDAIGTTFKYNKDHDELNIIENNPLPLTAPVA